MIQMLKQRKLASVLLLTGLFLVAAVSVSVALGTSDPTIVSSNATVNGSSVTVTFTVSDPDLIANNNYYIKLPNGTPVASTLQYRGHTAYDSCSGASYYVIDGYDQATITGTADGVPDGSQSFEIAASDRLGNTVSKQLTVNVAAGPAFTDMAPASGVTSSNNSKVSVKVTDNGQLDPATIAMTVDSQPVTHAFDASTSMAVYTAQPALANGLHTVSVSARDAAGNTNTATWSFTVMASGPQVTFANAGKTLSTASPTLAAAVSSSVKLDSTNYGMAVNGKSVSSSFNYKGHFDYPLELDPVWVIDSENDGTITGTPASLKDGKHTLAVTAKDTLGNTVNPSFDFYVNAFPAFSGAVPADKASTTDNTGFSVNVADNDGVVPTSVAVYLDSSVVTASFDAVNGIVTCKPVGGVPNGTHTVKVSATDTTGNTASYSWTFTVQATAADITFANDGQTLDTNRPTLKVAVKSNVKIIDTQTIMKIDGQKVDAAWTYKGHTEYPFELDPYWAIDSYNEGTLTYFPASLDDGPHEMVVSTTDVLGNMGTKTFHFSIAQKPVISGFDPANGSTISNKSPIIKAVITDPNGPAINKSSVVMTINGQQVVPTLTDSPDGSVNVSLSNKTLAGDTYHSITVTASDTAASVNTGTATWTFYINNKGDMPVDAKGCGSCHSLNQNNKYQHSEGPLGIGVGHSSPTHFYGRSCSHCHGGYNEKTCGYCHNADISLWWDGDGWVRPNPVPDPTISAGQDCTYCHSGNNGGWVPSEYAADHFYWVNNIINTGVEPFKPLYPDLSYTLRHDILPLHKVEKGTCNNCHSTYLTREHNRKNKNGEQITCATCHSSTDPKVQGAIAAKNLDCFACHTQADHELVHSDTLDSNCQTCHKATLTSEHLNNDKTTAGKNYTCETCHTSTNKAVVRSISAGNVTCGGCHGESKTHKVFFADQLPADIPLYPEFKWTAPMEASIYTDDNSASFEYANGQVVVSNRMAGITAADMWTFYNNQLTTNGWNLKSGAPVSGAQLFSAAFVKDSRQVTVNCYNTDTADGTGAPVASGYRVEIWYK